MSAAPWRRLGAGAVLVVLVVSASALAEPALAQEGSSPPGLVISQRNHVVEEHTDCRADEELRIERTSHPNRHGDGKTYLVRTHIPGRALTTKEYTVKLDKAPPQGKAVQVMVWDSEDIAAVNSRGATFEAFEDIIHHHGHYDYGDRDWDLMRGKISVENLLIPQSTNQKQHFSWLNFTQSNWNTPQTVRVKVHCDAHAPALQVPIYNVAVEYNKNDLPRDDRGLLTHKRPTSSLTTPSIETKLWKLDRTSVGVVYFAIRDNTLPALQTLGPSQDDGSDDQQQDDPFPDPGALDISDVTASSMTLSWSQRDVDHYLVYWGENVANSDVQSAQVDAGTLTYTISGLEADTDYAVIVYSQDYDEVTPTGYQRTAAAAQASCDPSASSEAIAKARAAFAWHSSYGTLTPMFWRILNTLGADNMPAKPSEVTADTISAQDVSDYSDGRAWPGWAPIVKALEDCEASTSTDTTDTTDTTVPVVPPPATPEVSVNAGSGVIEGGVATFTISANPSPAAAVDVTVSVSATGDYGVTVGQRTITIPTSGSATLSVATSGDAVDESDGSVSVSVNSGTGYTVSSTAGSATVAVSDDDDPPPPPTPEVSIAAGSGVTEGGSATFTLIASPAPTSPLPVTVSVTQSGDYGVSTGSQTVTIPTSGSYTLTVATSDDSVDESDGSVTVTVNPGNDYDVSSSNGDATVTISDDDDPPPPVVNSTPTLSISDASGSEGDTITFTVTLSPSSSRYVWVNYYARPAYGDAQSATYADFGSVYGTLTFNPGETSKTISVTLIDDSQPEGDETFVFSLYGAVQAKLGDREAAGTIIDND